MATEKRICSNKKCNREYDLTEEHFNYRDKSKGTFRTECKKCQKIANDKWQEIHKEEQNRKKRERYANDEEFRKQCIKLSIKSLTPEKREDRKRKIS